MKVEQLHIRTISRRALAHGLQVAREPDAHALRLIAARKNVWQIAVLTLMLSLFGIDLSSAATVSATPSKTSVQVAEPFWVDLIVTAPAGSSVTFPTTGDKLGSFDVIDTRDMFDIPSTEKPDQRTWSRKVQLETIETGDLTIPAFDIQVDDHQASRVVQTQPIAMRVVSVLEGQADPTQYRDIHSVVNVVATPPQSNRWLWITLAGFATVGFATAAVIAMFRRKAWISPSEWAFARLDQLEASMKNSPLKSEAVATELSSIARDYLQLQYSLAEPGRTAPELLNTLQTRSQIQETDAAKLHALFEVVDKINFAGIELSNDALIGAALDLRIIVTSIADDLQNKAQPSELVEST